jgi:hypothetical protein
MAQGFAKALNLEYAPAELTPEEQAAAEQIRAERYANAAWTERR